jgi:hypothetical protein
LALAIARTTVHIALVIFLIQEPQISGIVSARLRAEYRLPAFTVCLPASVNRFILVASSIAPATKIALRGKITSWIAVELA